MFFPSCIEDQDEDKTDLHLQGILLSNSVEFIEMTFSTCIKNYIIIPVCSDSVSLKKWKPITFNAPPPHTHTPWQTNETENGNFIEGFVFVVHTINRHNLIQLK